MHMHHITYDTFGNESLDDIVPACGVCNVTATKLYRLLPESERTHHRDGKGRVTMIDVTEYMRSYFAEIGELPTDLSGLK